MGIRLTLPEGSTVDDVAARLSGPMGRHPAPICLI
jgi:hypothetical protein